MHNQLKKVAKLLAATAIAGTTAVSVHAHPHVFVEANIEVVRNASGEFTELRQVWRFDELFSSTILLDYDDNTDGKLDEKEIKAVTDIVKESIAEYDFYTAIRADDKPLEFYEPDKINAYYEGNQLIMFLSVEPTKSINLKQSALKVSASDSSYYVAFEFNNESITIEGNSDACNVSVVHPDFDKIYATTDSLTEAFFQDPQNSGFGDEFYSWANIKC
ncbi:MAG: DUF1007 family protein [Pseudomonadota bacterium]